MIPFDLGPKSTTQSKRMACTRVGNFPKNRVEKTSRGRSWSKKERGGKTHTVADVVLRCSVYLLRISAHRPIGKWESLGESNLQPIEDLDAFLEPESERGLRVQADRHESVATLQRLLVHCARHQIKTVLLEVLTPPDGKAFRFHPCQSLFPGIGFA